MDKQKILVVDDEPANLNLVRQILKADYELTFAKSGADAITNALKHQPDLVLLDVMMPEMDGHEVCRRLKEDERTRTTPIIFCTAMTEEGDEAKGFALGAVDYITKPVRPSVVKARVATHLQLSNQNRALEEKSRELHGDLIETRLKTLQMLGKAAEFKDNETGLHVIRMSHYSRLLAKALGWNDEDCDLILNAAPMHDIGKIGTPDAILQKPGPLTDEELVVMRKHCLAGAEIIAEANSTDRLFFMAAEIAMCHHEKWDGSGYPRGLVGEDIPASARIVAIADVFDALSSDRPYKSAWPLEKTLALLKDEAGRHFDPDYIEAFLSILPELLEIQSEWKEEF